jgi:hypothetical protein
MLDVCWTLLASAQARKSCLFNYVIVIAAIFFITPGRAPSAPFQLRLQTKTKLGSVVLAFCTETKRGSFGDCTEGSTPLPELNADRLSAPPDNLANPMLVVALRHRQFETVGHLRRHRRYDLGPVGRDIHHLTFDRIAARHNDPRRHLADAPDSSFDLS